MTQDAVMEQGSKFEEECYHCLIMEYVEQLYNKECLRTCRVMSEKNIKYSYEKHQGNSSWKKERYRRGV